MRMARATRKVKGMTMPRFYPHGSAAPEDGLPPFLIVTGLGAWAYQTKAEALNALAQLTANGTHAKMLAVTL